MFWWGHVKTIYWSILVFVNNFCFQDGRCHIWAKTINNNNNKVRTCNYKDSVSNQPVSRNAVTYHTSCPVRVTQHKAQRHARDSQTWREFSCYVSRKRTVKDIRVTSLLATELTCYKIVICYVYASRKSCERYPVHSLTCNREWYAVTFCFVSHKRGGKYPRDFQTHNTCHAKVSNS